MFKTPEEAQDFAATLTLSADGLPAIDNDPLKLTGLVEHNANVGKDRFTLQRYVAWAAKRETAVKAQAAETARQVICPLTAAQLAEFVANGIGLAVTVEGAAVTHVKPMRFSTGGYGWNVTGKVPTTIAGRKCFVQVSGNFSIIGSKNPAAE